MEAASDVLKINNMDILFATLKYHRRNFFYVFVFVISSISSFSFNSNDFYFIENKGQLKSTSGKSANYVSHYFQKENTNIYVLRDGGIAFQFQRKSFPENYSKIVNEKDVFANEFFEIQKQVEIETFRMDFRLIGCNTSAHIESDGISSDDINFYHKTKVKTNHSKKVRFKNIYPNIDWEIYIVDNGGIKYDFIVHPGGNPNDIKLLFKNHDSLYIDKGGNLVHKNAFGYFLEDAPLSYQDSLLIPSNFILSGDTLLFNIGKYNTNAKLTIDPQRIWGTYYGGNDEELAYSTAVDSENNVYLAGWTRSTSSIASLGFQNSFGGDIDAFLVKFDSAGNRLWATYYGGNDVDYGYSCTVDKSDNIYLAGHTGSNSGISFNGHQNSIGGSLDAFLVKFNKDGNRIWGTYYGGSRGENGKSCVTDINNNVYLVGNTHSLSDIAFNGFQMTHAGSNNLNPSGSPVLADAFIVKFDSNGVRLWGSYYGGSDLENGNSCATDIYGNVFLSGSTSSQNNISFSGFKDSLHGGLDGFLVKFDSLGVRQWGTYFGGIGMDPINSCKTDSLNNIFIAGTTSSDSNIAFGSVHQNTFGGGSFDAYLAKFNNNGVLLWGTYFGGDREDGASCISIDKNNNIFISGNTNSLNNISADGHQNTYGGGSRDAFISKFSPNGNRLWASYYGGNSLDIGTTVSVDNSNKVYLGGYTGSGGNNIAFSGHQNVRNGDRDGFLVKFDCATFSDTVITSCYFFQSPSNKYIWDTSGIFYDTIVNSQGCDSIIEIELNIIDTSYTQQYQVVCDSFVWQLNNQTYMNSGTYEHTLTNSNGCDSIIVLNLIVNYSDTINQSIQACNEFTWPANNVTYFQSGVYHFTYSNNSGCDSIIILDLEILEESYSTKTITACDEYNWETNNQTYTLSGLYTDTLTSYKGCDSIITLNLTILESTSSISEDSSCISYTWSQNGAIIFKSGIYSDTLINVLGCDSILFLDLIIDTVDTRVLDSAASLVAQADNATFQWFNCDNSFVPVRGATSNVFSPSDNSQYAAEIRQNGCVDTSACYSIFDIGVVEYENSDIRLYPNPNSGEFSIDLGREFKECTIIIHDVNGRQVARFLEYDSRLVTKSIDVASGVYVVQIFTEYGFKNVLMTVL